MSPEQVKEKFKREGKTITAWAKEHGYSRNSVYRVLNGFDKGIYGKSYEIAKKLGLRDEGIQNHE